MHLPYAAAAPLCKGAETEQISGRAEGGLGDLRPGNDDADLNYIAEGLWGARDELNLFQDDVSAAEFQVGCHEH